MSSKVGMKQKFSKSIFFKLLMVFVGFSLLAAGCGGGGGGSNESLVVWTVYDNDETLRPVIESFRAKRKGVEVKLQVVDPGDYEDQLLNAMASGRGPDVFFIHNSWLPKYLDKISPAESSVWQYSDYKNTFVDALSSDFTKDRQVYGASLYVDSLALFYNKDLLGTAGIARPPRTWAELEVASRKLARLNINGYFSRSGVALGLSSVAPGGQINRAEDVLYLLMLQKGVKPWSEDGLSPEFGSGDSAAAAEEALRFYTSFADPAGDNYTWNTLSDYSIDAFANSRAGLMINYSYARGLIEQKASNLNYDVAPVPQQSLDVSESNFASYWGMVVSKQSELQKEAWDFIKAATSKDALDKYAGVTKLPSSRRDLIELQVNDPEVGVFAHANLTAKTFYRPDQPKFDAIIAEMIDDVALRGSLPREALSKAQAQAAEIPTGK